MALYEVEGKNDHIDLTVKCPNGKEYPCVIPIIYGSDDGSKSDQKPKRDWVIYKYPLQFINNRCAFESYRIKKILHLKAVNDIPTLWCVVDKNSDKSFYELIAFGTGHEFGIINLNAYIGSYSINCDKHTYHVFSI